MTTIVTPDICDAHPSVHVVDPMFNNYGGRPAFGGEIVTVKCFEDNSVVKEQVSNPGKGKVMVVDGGGSNGQPCWGICSPKRLPRTAGKV